MVSKTTHADLVTLRRSGPDSVALKRARALQRLILMNLQTTGPELSIVGIKRQADFVSSVPPVPASRL